MDSKLSFAKILSTNNILLFYKEKRKEKENPKSYATKREREREVQD